MRLFKFQPINKYSLHGLATRSFFYAKPAVFNDPYEFVLHDDVCSDEFLQSVRQEDETKSEISKSELRAELKKEIRRQLADFGVVSFSERDDSPLMWGHYAQNHEGMCLEFDVADPEGSVFPINYSDELALLDAPDAGFWHLKNVGKALTTKHTDWSYEQEHRILQVNGGTCQPYLDNFALVSVAFGIRCPDDDIKLVQHVLAGVEVAFRRAVLDSKKAKISFLPYAASKS